MATSNHEVSKQINLGFCCEVQLFGDQGKDLVVDIGFINGNHARTAYQLPFLLEESLADLDEQDLTPEERSARIDVMIESLMAMVKTLKDHVPAEHLQD